MVQLGSWKKTWSRASWKLTMISGSPWPIVLSWSWFRRRRLNSAGTRSSNYIRSVLWIRFLGVGQIKFTFDDYYFKFKMGLVFWLIFIVMVSEWVGLHQTKALENGFWNAVVWSNLFQHQASPMRNGSFFTQRVESHLSLMGIKGVGQCRCFRRKNQHLSKRSWRRQNLTSWRLMWQMQLQSQGCLATLHSQQVLLRMPRTCQVWKRKITKVAWFFLIIFSKFLWRTLLMVTGRRLLKKMFYA